MVSGVARKSDLFNYTSKNGNFTTKISKTESGTPKTSHFRKENG
jgi:hypothetical protein